MREMREDVRDMGSDLRTDMRNIRKDLGGVKTILGSLYGTHVCAEVAKLLGQDYSRQLTASSVWDFLTLLFDGATQRPATITDHRQLVEMGRRIAAKLVEEQLPTRLLRSIHYRLEPTEQGWYDSEPDLSKLGAFIGSCEDMPLREALQRLEKVVALSADAQKEELLGCNSAGAMCVLAAALPELYLSGSSNPDRFPQQNLEFDLCGRMEVALDGSFARCDIGIILDADPASGVQQMGVRLRALAWLVSAMQPRGDLKVVLVGRLFLPTGVRFDASQQEEAMQPWNYNLRVHYV